MPQKLPPFVGGKDKKMPPEQSHETVIIGAGPAGLQLAYFLEKAGRDYVILEGKERAGSYFERYPRHRKLLSINKQYTGRDATDFNLRHDWNCLITHPGDEMPFKDFSTDYFPHADVLVEYLNAFRDRFDLKVEFGFRVATINKGDNGEGFAITRDNGQVMRCRRLVVATGVNKPFIPDIPGIEHADGYEDMSIEPEDFAGKTVLVIGKGNSALETAQHLMPYASFIHLSSRAPVKFAWDSHFVGHVRSVNCTFFDSYLLKSQNAVFDGPTRGIVKLDSGKLRVRWSATHQDVEEEIEQIDYDHVIRCCGFRFDDSIFGDDCKPRMTIEDRFPEMTGGWKSSNVEGLYFAGILMQSIDYKASQSSFIHGFRYNVRTLFRLLEEEGEKVPLPSDSIELTAAAVADKALARSNSCSALWQQVGFMCDVLVLPRDGKGPGRWYYDLNYKYVLREMCGKDPDCEFYISMLMYGPRASDEGYPGNAFNHPHVHPHTTELAHGDWTTEIHPVLRRFRGDQLQVEYHVKSDVLTDWDSEFYREPLIEFLEWDLMKGPRPKWVKPRRRELIRDESMRFAEFRSEGVGKAEPADSEEPARTPPGAPRDGGKPASPIRE